jgi:ribonuclease D
MTASTLPTPIFIKRPFSINEMAVELDQVPIIAVDTESNSLYAYQEQVCLLQVSTPSSDYLVDTLAVQDLTQIGSVFNNPNIEKVFHAAEYDLMCIKRDFDISFRNIFDTMIAAGILGRHSLGLGKILEKEFNVVINKRHQRANWGKRPLPEHLLSYAQLDTHYLIPLRDRLKNELEERGLWLLAQEDFNRSCKRIKIPNSPSSAKNAGCWRISGAYDLEPYQAAVLSELCRYRNNVARSKNRPLFKIISDKALLVIAQYVPQSLDEMRILLGNKKKQVDWLGRGLLRAVQRGLQAEPVYPPSYPRPDGKYLHRLESLRQWRKSAAEEMGVKSDIVLPKDLLIDIAEKSPSDEKELEKVMLDVPWRFENFGSQILNVLTWM